MPSTSTQSSERRTVPKARPSPRLRSRPALCDPAYSSISAWCPSIGSPVGPSVGVSAGRLLHLDVEIGPEDLRGGGRRRGPAVAAVLDHGTDDDLRVVGRAVAAPPGLVLHAHVPRKRDDLLGGSRLAGDRDRELAGEPIRGATRKMRALEQALPDDLQRGRID